MKPNRIKAKLQAGEVSVGAWLSCSHRLIAELMTQLGFDWLLVDTEHSSTSMETAETMVQIISASDVVPLVRVPWNDIVPIKYALDSGAYGVIIPMVNTAAEARRAVQLCKYPPQGIRGLGGARVSISGGADYTQRANEEIAVIIQIETVEALKNIDEILAVEGIDVAFVGPADLSASLGLRPQTDGRDPRFLEALHTVVAAGRRHGVPTGIFCGSAEAVNDCINWGFRFISLANDLYLLRYGAQIERAKIKV